MKQLMFATIAGAALLAGAGVASAQTYGQRYGSPEWNDTHATLWNSSAPRGGTYKMNAFKSQELLPQSPPAVGGN